MILVEQTNHVESANTGILATFNGAVREAIMPVKSPLLDWVNFIELLVP